MREALANAGASLCGATAMSQADRERWDPRYREGGYSCTPAAFVVAYAPAPAPGARALDVACGAGRNSLYLAEMGYHVDAVDVSPVALTLLKEAAEGRGLADRVTCIEADLDVWRPLSDTYDLVVQTGFYDAALLAPVRDAVRAGGYVIVESFNLAIRTQRVNFSLAHAMQRGTLAAAFARWDVLAYSDSVPPSGSRSHIVARRPTSAW